MKNNSYIQRRLIQSSVPIPRNFLDLKNSNEKKAILHKNK